MSGARVLVVDDDPAILRAVRHALEGQGYQVRALAEGSGVLEAMRHHPPDVILLDLALPDVDGLTICRAVREESAVPIIVLSAIGDDETKVAALDLGADDYLTKPFSIQELTARIRVALRRSAGGTSGARVAAGPIAIDLERREVTVGGAAVHLTPKEFQLCRLLVQHEGKLLTGRHILGAVWGPEYADDGHILRTFVHQLRTKFEAAAPGSSSLIVNDPGVGYRLVAKS